MAGIVGVAIGAAVGSAATAILTDQEKRTKVAHAIKGFHKKAMNAAGSLTTKSKQLQDKTEDNISQAAKKLEEGADAIKRQKRQV